MKFYSILFLFTLTLCTTLKAQEGNRERIEVQRIAFITQRIGLKPEEAQQFWPIFNEYSAKVQQIKQSSRWEAVNDMSDAEAEKMILAEFDKESKELDLKKEYFQKFKKVLSVKKVIRLYRAERDFKAELIKYLRNRREEKRGGTGKD